MALSDKSGTAEFHLSNWHDASSLLKPQSTGSSADQYTASSKSIQVTVDTIDQVCERESISHINLLKIDAQGAELRILNGVERMLRSNSVDLIYTEVVFLQFDQQAGQFDQIMKLLVEHNFRLHNLYDLTQNQHDQLAHCEAIFLNNR